MRRKVGEGTMAYVKLTKNQQIFCDEYLIDRNATRAYLVAYPNVKKESVAAACGSRLLTNAKIKAYLDSRLEEIAKKSEISIERVLQEYAKLAFFNPKDLFDVNGSPKNINDLDDDVAAAIAGLEVIDTYEGVGEFREFIGYTKKYKLADKKGTLDSLARHLGMFKDKVEISGQVNNPMEGLTTEELKKLIYDE